MSAVEENVMNRLLDEAKSLQNTMHAYSNVFIENTYRGVGPKAEAFYTLLRALENYLNKIKGE